jgi:hypothetical protein
MTHGLFPATIKSDKNNKKEKMKNNERKRESDLL